jgi:hypothetical protein
MAEPRGMRPVDLLVRLEWLAVLIMAVAAYWSGGYAWWIFALLILAPDLSMVGYLAGPYAGAIAYNVVHTVIAPLALAAVGLWFGVDWALQIAIILMAHIAIDRVLGYGLKLSTGFKDTHLGRIGGA